MLNLVQNQIPLPKLKILQIVVIVLKVDVILLVIKNKKPN